MNKYTAFSILVLCAASTTHAQELTYHVSTTVPDTAGYEIVQSSVLAKLTFRLDRNTGRTWQIGDTSDGGYVWQEVLWLDDDSSESRSSQPRYQIFSSGILARVTVLMNTDTGRSWYIAEDDEIGFFWTPFD